MGKENVKVTCRCKVDKSYPLSPNGILKIIEMILGLIMLILVAVGSTPSSYTVDSRSDPSVIEYASFATTDLLSVYYPCLRFSIAAVAICWVVTIIIFFLFLFCVPEIAGGNQIWNMVDLILDVIWIVIYVIVFILVCVTCGYPVSHEWSYSAPLLVAIFFAILLLVAYILSLVFAIFAMKAKNLY